MITSSKGVHAEKASYLESVASGRMSTGRIVAVAAAVYALLVVLMWAPFTAFSGLPFETAFPYMSETRSAVDGFFYTADPLRVHTNTFYHLSYLLGEAVGAGGSYIPFQVVHACLWWARGFLVFLLLRQFLPDHPAVSYVAGSLVVVHASDGAMQWIGQMNQFGFIFWMLLAWYFLTVAFKASSAITVLFLTIAACSAEYMSLWSYESQILLLLVFPIALLMHCPRRWRRLVAMAAAWYSVPSVYVVLTMLKYSQSGATYQQTVIRTGWRPTDLFSDWFFNIASSLEFWTWVRGDWKTPTGRVMLLSLCAAAVFCAGGLAVIRFARANVEHSGLVPARITCWRLLACGFVALALSFPVYLLLDSARGLWRTQFLSGIGSGVVLTALLSVAMSYGTSVRRSVKSVVFLALAGVVVYCGSASALQKGAFHRWLWERHRRAIAHVLKTVPSVKPNAVIALVNVPKEDDPFGHDMWFDVALRLVYPGTPVAGIYFYPDGTPAPGDNLKMEGGRWKWDGTGFPPVVRDTSIANTIVIDRAASGSDALVPSMPSFMCETPCASQLYNPAAVITGTISPRTVRRYRLYSPL